MAKKNSDDQYSNEEAQRRFEAALHGARDVGHETMKSLPRKRAKVQRKRSKAVANMVLPDEKKSDR